jgi:hypothetical protein
MPGIIGIIGIIVCGIIMGGCVTTTTVSFLSLRIERR